MTEKRLIVMRHAKSSWNGPITDHERPLNERGCGDANHMGVILEQMGWVPELILSSDSQRTQETLERMTPAFSTHPTVRMIPEFYLGGLEQIREALGSTDTNIKTALVLGHNPGWEEAAEWLSGNALTLKTANAALLQGPDIPWEDLVSAKHRFRFIEQIRP